jgi:hypothetical protein
VLHGLLKWCVEAAVHKVVMQVCAVLDRDSEALYRRQISAVNPDASILKGPFEVAARASVGLPSSWYLTQQWPEEDQQRLLQEKYLDGPSYNTGGGDVLSAADLRLLRERIASFCEAEECMSW